MKTRAIFVIVFIYDTLSILGLLTCITLLTCILLGLYRFQGYQAFKDITRNEITISKNTNAGDVDVT